VEILTPQPVPLACDGEVVASGRHFSFAARDTAIRVYRPEDRSEPA
jgi:diacylglycerol kinase family enzyme